MNDAAYEYRHMRCGGISFWLKRRPLPGDLVEPNDVRLLDGTTPLSHERIVCGSCGEAVGRLQAVDLFEMK